MTCRILILSLCFILSCGNPTGPNETTRVEIRSTSETSVRFGYELEKESIINMEIHNFNGVLIRVLINGHASPAGRYQIIWNFKGGDGSIVEPGTYFIVINNDTGQSGGVSFIVP